MTLRILLLCSWMFQLYVLHLQWLSSSSLILTWKIGMVLFHFSDHRYSTFIFISCLTHVCNQYVYVVLNIVLSPWNINRLVLNIDIITRFTLIWQGLRRPSGLCCQTTVSLDCLYWRCYYEFHAGQVHSTPIFID